MGRRQQPLRGAPGVVGVVLGPEHPHPQPVGGAPAQHGRQGVALDHPATGPGQPALGRPVVAGQDPGGPVLGGLGHGRPGGAVGARGQAHHHPGRPLARDVGEGRRDHAGDLLRDECGDGGATAEIGAVVLAGVDVEGGHHDDRRRDPPRVNGPLKGLGRSQRVDDRGRRPPEAVKGLDDAVGPSVVGAVTAGRNDVDIELDPADRPLPRRLEEAGVLSGEGRPPGPGGHGVQGGVGGQGPGRAGGRLARDDRPHQIGRTGHVAAGPVEVQGAGAQHQKRGEDDGDRPARPPQRPAPGTAAVGGRAPQNPRRDGDRNHGEAQHNPDRDAGRQGDGAQDRHGTRVNQRTCRGIALKEETTS